jgi:uncharacterized OB-fold protein
MSGKPALADWTAGAEAIVYQCCGTCGNLQYFSRSFCCACGAPDPVEKHAGGEGTVYATRWSSAPPRRKPARTFPTTSFWSICPKAFA